MQKPSAARFFVLTTLATVLTALFIFLGAPLIRVLRNVFGPIKFWSAAFVGSALLWSIQLQPLALINISVWLVIGLYSEAEEHGFAGIVTGLVALFVGATTLMGGFWYWAKTVDLDIMQIMTQGVEKIYGQLRPVGSGATTNMVDLNLILNQIPSAVVLLLMTALAFALILDRKTSLAVGLNFEKIATHIRLLEFRVPDLCIWITMFSFLFSFTKMLPPIGVVVASNVFNIMMGLYFFQGLAVLEVLFLFFRAGNFTKFLIYFFIVGQLFLLLSAVGIIDYWVDFRSRMRRMRRPEKNQKNGEHI